MSCTAFVSDNPETAGFSCSVKRSRLSLLTCRLQSVRDARSVWIAQTFSNLKQRSQDLKLTRRNLLKMDISLALLTPVARRRI